MGAEPYLLVIEDSEDDLFLLSRALRQTGVTHAIDCAADGTQGIKYLKALITEGTDPVELPSLVILNIETPIENGHEVLAWICSQPALVKLPVCVLSSSQLEGDASAAREFGASDYRTKPTSLAEYHLLAAKIKNLLTPPAQAA